MFRTFAAMAVFAITSLASGIDGKWLSERKFERDGQTIKVVQTFDLRVDGAKLNGKFTSQFGDMEPAEGSIRNGKVDGDKFSFTTTTSTPNGDVTTTYKGELAGDKLKGTSEREGGTPRPFEAKRAPKAE